MSRVFILIGISIMVLGCSTIKGNVGQMATYNIPSVEAGWIRDGDPIEFEDDFWYPTDEIGLFLDSEMYLLGEYKGVQFFVERRDVMPFNQLYTKFARNKFRIFEKRNND